MGGCGFWIGCDQQFTHRSWLYLPSKAKGSSLAHAFMIRSCASPYLSRVRVDLAVAEVRVIGVPTGEPAMSRPPEITSSMANSSATRIGGL